MEKNDVLYVYVRQPVEILEWRIYTRWGEEVFAAEHVYAGYPEYRSATGWDGTIHGRPARPDVYMWWLQYRCGRQIVFKKGDVTLLR